MKRAFQIVFLLFLVGCASSSEVTEPQGPLAADQMPADAPKEGDLNDNESDMAKLPAELNEKVTEWIEYFKGRGRGHMTTYLSRSSRYLPEMKKILKSHGLPEDLVYIALIESGFSSKAYSRARAVGYWQFIGGTGKRYGLKQNYYIDERRDFIRSTEAAALYLKALYNLFGSWYLAIASYNVGENRIKNLVMTHYTRDFWELAVKHRLPGETINYVPKFLAARLIAKHPEKYGFTDVGFQPPLAFKEVPLPPGQGVDFRQLAKALQVSYEDLTALNPSYLRGLIPKMKGVSITLRVPPHIEESTVVAALQKSATSIAFDNIVSDEGQVYTIRSGDTLSHLASRFNVSIRSIQEVNNLSSRAVLYPGKKIVIPGRKQTVPARTTTAQEQAPVELAPGEKAYTVQEGDNLYNIAKKFGVSLAKIRERNQLNSRTLLNIGKVLIIPQEAGSSI